MAAAAATASERRWRAAQAGARERGTSGREAGRRKPMVNRSVDEALDDDDAADNRRQRRAFTLRAHARACARVRVLLSSPLGAHAPLLLRLFFSYARHDSDRRRAVNSQGVIALVPRCTSACTARDDGGDDAERK